MVIGRESQGMINVGGNKVSAKSIERVILGHPDVLWCKVFGHKAPIIGILQRLKLSWHQTFRKRNLRGIRIEISKKCQKMGYRMYGSTSLEVLR